MSKISLPEITKEEKAQLVTYARSEKAEYRMRLRGQIILDWINGLTYSASCERNDVSQVTITKWRRRFSEAGLTGLKDAPRSGKPREVDAEIRSRVIHLARQRTNSGTQKYSQHEIADQTHISQSHVSNILRAARLKPHKTDYWCGKSPDPHFEEKMVDIVGLYLNPPENALVLSVDEKTQIQALDRTQPDLPLRTGNPRQLTTTYKRHGIVNLMAALATETREITAPEVPRNNSEHFLKFLKYIDRKYTNLQIHLIMDNLNVHKSKKASEWLESKRKFYVYFTPTYSSWLNQIEIWFSILTRDIIKDGVWHSKKEMTGQLIKYVKTYNEDKAHPFNWTYGKQYLTN
jgi:transposase